MTRRTLTLANFLSVLVVFLLRVPDDLGKMARPELSEAGRNAIPTYMAGTLVGRIDTPTGLAKAELGWWECDPNLHGRHTCWSEWHSDWLGWS